MLENGFYKVKQEYIELIREVGGIYKDAKERPIFCCVEDRYIKGLYWAIPTSDLSHRSTDQIEKIEKWCLLNERDIRWSYYYIGHTNRPALYRISSCFPITEKYVEGPYTSNGHHLVLQRKKDIEIIRKKLSRILLTENRTPNKFEQCITNIKNRLIREL
ncbi:MAG: hypothetical protein R3Y24_00610 [Eubacteriales bacterium]